MDLDATTAKVTDIRVYYDRVTPVTSNGRILWATVEIDYKLHGMAPDISIWLPVKCTHIVGSNDCRAQILRSARALLLDVCNSIAMASDGAIADIDTVTDKIGDYDLTSLPGPSLELRLATPITRPSEQQQHQ